MKRRTALKNLTLSIGYTVATPTLFNMLSSCTADKEIWTPVFLSSNEKHLVTHLVDIILPVTNIPGALDVNVPQFIDVMYKNIELVPNKLMFKKGAEIFEERFQNMFNKKVLKGTKEDILTLFKFYFSLPKEEQQKVILLQQKDESEISEDKKADFLMYKFLFSVRYYTLFGYYTSKRIGTEILNYDPVPGVYNGCVPLEEIGNSWSL